jgi:F-type H+-transporting ATPase subunit b
MEAFTKLGIDWRLLVAQLINFAILFWVLRKFLYKPILDVLEKRKTTIEKGFEDAKKAEHALSRAEKDAHALVQKAKQEAVHIIDLAQKTAHQERQEVLQKAKDEVHRIIYEAREKILAERQDMIESVQKELVSVVMEAASAVLRGVSDKKISAELTKKAIDEI